MSAGLTLMQDGGRRSARQIVEALGLREPVPVGGRPRVVAAMIASADGRAAVQGRSVALGHPADRALLRELRAGADALLVGTATLAAERYATLLDPEQRARRVATGLPEHPVLATVSRALRLPVDAAPVFGEAGTRIVAFTESPAAPPKVAAALDVVRAPEGGGLPLSWVLEELAARYEARGVLCEGGPSLLRRLVAEDCLDDLLLTVAPWLAAGAAPGVLEGDELPTPAALSLVDVHRAEDHVFLHYSRRARGVT